MCNVLHMLYTLWWQTEGVEKAYIDNDYFFLVHLLNMSLSQ